MKMKAYTVQYDPDPLFSTVVFAETAGKARAIAQHTDACEDCDFIDIRALRVPVLDPYYKGKPEMDWYDMEDRVAMVKLANYECSREVYDPECDDCPAKEWCGRYESDHDDENPYSY